MPVSFQNCCVFPIFLTEYEHLLKLSCPNYRESKGGADDLPFYFTVFHGDLGFSLLQDAMVSMFVFHQSSYIEILTPEVMI